MTVPREAVDLGPLVPAPRRATERPRPADVPTLPAPRTSPERATPDNAVPTGTAPASTVPRPGVPEIVVAAAVYVGLQVGLGALVVGAGLGGPWLAAVSALAAFGAVGAALALRTRHLAPLALDPARPAMLVAGVGIGVGTWVTTSALMALWLTLGGTLPASQEGLWQLGGAGALVALGLLAVLVVPVAEELLFRGLLVSALARHGLVVAATVSAALFALAHGLAFVAVAAVLLGVANTVTVWRWRTIRPAVVAHATFNAISFGLTAASLS